MRGLLRAVFTVLAIGSVALTAACSAPVGDEGAPAPTIGSQPSGSAASPTSLKGVAFDPAERKALFARLAALPIQGQATRIVPKLVRPSVVNILVQQARSHGNKLGSSAKGTGFILRAEGYIGTNYHVIEGHRGIRVVTIDGRVFTATVRGLDKKSDLAVLKITGEHLIPVVLGDSDALEIGEPVMAIGYSFGTLGHSVSLGIVSGIGRSDLGVINNAFGYEYFIQTDAAMNSGNSGGPLVNMRGAVVGINTAIVTEQKGFQGVGLAVPVNQARFVFDQLIEHGTVRRGWLGVDIQDLTPERIAKETGQTDLAAGLDALGLKRLTGIYVVRIDSDGPAAKATPALKPGDIIIAYNTIPFDRIEPFREKVARSPIGKKATLTVIRNKKTIKITVQIGQQPGS